MSQPERSGTSLGEHVAAELERTRRRSALLTDAVDDADLVRQHSPLMSPLVWDLAHIGNQEELWLVRDVGGREPVRQDIDHLYDAFKHARRDRPQLPLLGPAEARAYVATVRDKVLDVLDRLPATAALPASPATSPEAGRRLVRDGFAFGMIVQHEQQHDETMLATHQLRSGPPVMSAGPPPAVAQAYGDWQRALLAADFPGICRYRAANAALPPPTPQRIVFFGDSITEQWLKLRPAFFAGDRIDRGIGGQTTRQMIARFRADVIELRPAVVHILAGTNDLAQITGPTSLAEIEGHLASMAELARAHGIRVVFGAVLPARAYGSRPDYDPAPDIIALNGWLRAYAAREGHGFADYNAALDDGAHGLSPVNSADGIHPTAAGYAIMEPIAEKAIAGKQ